VTISIVELGNVGAVSTCCLPNGGHNVIGVDSAGIKSDVINRAQPPTVEAAIRDVSGRRREGQRLVDLVRISDRRSEGGAYDGICC
jgi:UDP-glucose 6-dehydrogenase